MTEAMWVWGVIGLVLLAAEMATGTFYVLWFGVAAIILAILTWLVPDLNVSTQLILFSVLSIGALFIWRNYYKKTSVDHRVGQSQGEEIGRIGIVTETTSPTQNGSIRFTQGLMGSREWVAVSDEAIEINSQAKVVAVEGNTLRIAKIS